jgi:hypothetical protein
VRRSRITPEDIERSVLEEIGTVNPIEPAESECFLLRASKSCMVLLILLVVLVKVTLELVRIVRT